MQTEPRIAALTYSAVLRTAVAAVLVGAGACGGPVDLPIPPGSKYVPSAWPSAWPGEAVGLVVVSESLWRIEDGAIGSCSRSSIYSVRADSVAVLRRGWGTPACKARVDQGGIRGKPDGSEAILVSDGRLVRWQFAKGAVLDVSLPAGTDPHWPAWMPDQKSLVFVSALRAQPNGGRRSGDAIFLVPPSGGDGRVVFSIPDRKVVSAPSSDPQQRRMVVATRSASGIPDSSPPEIVVLSPTDLTPGALVNGYDPVWSPTGEWIAYIARGRTNVKLPALLDGSSGPEVFFGELRVIRPDGRDDHVLAQGSTRLRVQAAGAFEGVPSAPLVWKSDGAALAFASASETGVAVWTVSIARPIAVKASAPPP